MRTATVVAILTLLSCVLGFGQSSSVTLQNQESSSFWFVIDPPELSDLDVGSRQLAGRVEQYFAAETEEVSFQEIAPDAQVTLTGLGQGAHFLVGFFDVEGEDLLPVRAFSVHVDEGTGDRFYALFSGPALLSIQRDAGRMRSLASAPAEVEMAAIEAEEPVEEAVAEKPVEPVEEVAAEEPVEPVQEVVVEEPVEPVEEVAAGEPVGPVEEVVVEEPVEPVEEVAAEEPVEPVEEVVVEEPVEPVEEVVAEEPVEPVEEVVAEEPVEPVEEVVAEEPVEPVEEVVAEEPVEPVQEEVAAVETVPAPETQESSGPVAVFAPNYDPVVFTRESGSAFTVLPISQSRFWGEAGTRLEALDGLLQDGLLRLTLKTEDGFSPQVSYFLYLFGERTLGRENTLTVEILPLAREGRGACVLWQKSAAAGGSRAVPRLLGSVNSFGRTCEVEISLADLSEEVAAVLGENPSMDLSSCRYDVQKGVFEEFYFTTLQLADFPGGAGETVTR